MFKIREESRFCADIKDTDIFMSKMQGFLFAFVFAACRCKNISCTMAGHNTVMCVHAHCVTRLCMSEVCRLAPHSLFPTFTCLLVLHNFVHLHCTVFFPLLSSPSLMHPPPSTPRCSASTLNNSSLWSSCIFGCCHLCSNTNTAYTSEPACTHTNI